MYYGFEMHLTAKDLRIGNYINYESTTHVVSEIKFDKLVHYWLSYKNDGYVTTYESILPIPLSKRELECLGFIEDSEDDKVYRIENSKFYVEEYKEEDYYLCYNNSKGVKMVITPISLVHEFQNIFFDLTKIELEY